MFLKILIAKASIDIEARVALELPRALAGTVIVFRHGRRI
jgi:hypothetical protein